MKHVVRLLLSLLLSFNMVVTPAWAQDATAGDAEKCRENDDSKENKLNCKEKEGSETLTKRGEKYSPGYLEMLMMLTLAMVMLTSPLPTRTERAKNDCLAQFAGPLSLLLMKLMGLVQIAGEITTAVKYNKVIKDYKKKHEDKDMAVYDTVASTSSETTSDKDKIKEQKKTKTKVLDMRATYEGYAEVFKEQQKVLEMKNGFYSATLAMIVTALALETTITSMCTAACVARSSYYLANEVANKAAMATYLSTVTTLYTTYLTTMAPAYAPAPPVAPATTPLYANFVRSMSTYLATSEGFKAANVPLALSRTTTALAEQGSTWGKVVADWAASMVPGGGVVTGAIDTTLIAKEEAVELSTMTTNQTLETTSYTKALGQALDVIIAEEEMVRLGATIDTATAIGLCKKLMVATAACDTPVSVGLATFISGLEAAKAAFKANRGNVAAAAAITGMEEAMGQTAGRAIDKMEKAFSGLNKASGNVGVSDAKDLANEVKSIGGKLMKRMVELAIVETIELRAPPIAFDIRNQKFRMTCCGSDGVHLGIPNSYVPIPNTPGIIFTKPDIKPPKGLLQAVTNNEKNPEIDKIFDTVMKNYQYEQIIAHTSNSFDPKNPKKMSQQFEVFEQQVANLDLNNKKMTPKEVNELKIAFYNIANVVGMPKAEADDAMKKMGPMMLLGGGLVVGMMMKKIIKKIYAFATRAPLNRIAFYALITALNASLMAGVKKNQKRIDEQLGVIYKLKDMTEEQMMGGAEFQLGTAQNNQAMGGGSGDGGQADEVLKKSGSNTCLNVTSSDVASAPCGNKQNLTSLHPSEMKDLNANFPAFSSATNSMTNLTSDFASGNNGNPGNFSSAQMGQFGSIQSAMRTRLDKAKKDLDKYAKEKNGKSTVDKMVAEIISSISKSDPSLAGLASHSPFPVSGVSVSPTLGGTGKDKITPAAASVPPTFKAPAIPNYGGESVGTFEAPIEETPVEAPAAGPTDSLDNYEVSQNDIIKQKDVSLFEVLSKRYLLSYPKILKKQEPKAEPAPSP